MANCDKNYIILVESSVSRALLWTAQEKFTTEKKRFAVTWDLIIHVIMKYKKLSVVFLLCSFNYNK